MINENKKNICRCPWVDLSKADYIEYHDKEWGVPVYNDRLLFEFLTLEYIYETYFIRGKMKIHKIYVVDGMPADEFYRANADPITLFQNRDYEKWSEQEI